jgi:bifunctional non-homologous end joining protein LigD
MLATAVDASVQIPLQESTLWYEPKYDGIRAIVSIEPGRSWAEVRLWSRAGNEKTAQFPELVKALQDMARGLRKPLVLDGEIVALDERGEPAGFQALQGRMHLTNEREIAKQMKAQAVALLVFDILRDGGDDLRGLPLNYRRAILERILEPVRSSTVRMGEYAAGDGRWIYEQALAKGWEGLLVKVSDSIYESGRRSHAWRKLKLLKQQEFVVGGWTEPRETRPYFGALLLGAYEPGKQPPPLRYVGHTGGGFTQKELAHIHGLLLTLETKTCPFSKRPATNERPHWTRPELVVQVRFTGWTNDGVMRQPVYLGLRDDIDPRTVVIEPSSAPAPAPQARAVAARSSSVAHVKSASMKSTPARSTTKTASAKTTKKAVAPKTRGVEKKRGIAPDAKTRDALQKLVDRLHALEEAKRDGTIELPDGSTLDVTNLAKVFWPDERLTKGDLIRFYAQISPFLLPAIADRPLIMRRFPNGIKGKAFYQQRAPDEMQMQPGVRVEEVEDDSEESGVMPRLIGGSLKTLLYMAQLASISQDPWFSRVQSREFADYAAIDLDPMPGVPFSQVLDVARAVHEELETLDIPGCPKTSGASGLHIYIPLPPETTYETGQLLCHVVAAIVSAKHRRIATIERQVAKRGRTVYVDYLQNIEGKTLATAYSARASEFAGVSTPLTWDEVHQGVAPQDFTLRNAIQRFERVGDLWADVVSGTSVDIEAVLSRLAKFAQ